VIAKAARGARGMQSGWSTERPAVPLCHWPDVSQVKPHNKQHKQKHTTHNPVYQGALKKKTNAHVHLQNPSKKHPPTSSFFSTFFLIAFSGVSQQVEFKNTQNSFWKKIDAENVYKKMRKFPFRFPPYFFFYCVFGRFSAWGVQTHQTKKPKNESNSSSSASQNKQVVYRFLTICRCGAVSSVRECTSSWAPRREIAVERLDLDRSDLQKWNPW
jgi:hypothetical protein